MIARLAINAQIIILQVAKIEIRYLLFWLLAVVGKILLSLFPKGFVLLLVDESLFPKGFVLLLVDESLFPKGLSPSRLLLFVDSDVTAELFELRL